MPLRHFSVEELVVTGDSSMTELIRGVKSADDGAVRTVWERFFPRLVQLAGQQLVGQKRQLADEEDVAISVMESFFRAAREGRFPDLADEDGIWRLLARMTQRKAVDLIRHNAARPCVGESALDETAARAHPLEAHPDSDPTPCLLATLSDEVRRLLEVLPEKYHEVALKKLECRTVPEIARECGVHVSTVERRLRIIRGIWEQEFQTTD